MFVFTIIYLSLNFWIFLWSMFSYHPRGDSWVPEGELLSELAE